MRTIDKKKLQDKSYYWVKWCNYSNWDIARYSKGDEIFSFIDYTYRPVSMIFDVNPNPVIYTNKEIPCMIGVGNGDGNHFVHGDYDTIKLLQDKLMDYERIKLEHSELLKRYHNTQSIH